MRENTFSKIIGAPWTRGTVKLEVDKINFSVDWIQSTVPAGKNCTGYSCLDNHYMSCGSCKLK